jgi:hypothetical protein
MFDGDTDTPKQEDTKNSGDPTPSSTNPFDDKLKAIVNENGEPKYKDVESALEALNHSQKFIDTLKAEKQTLEQKFNETQSELEKRESVEDVVKRLTSGKPEDKGNDQSPAPKGLDEEGIRKLVQAQLDQQTQAQKQNANLSRVISDLTSQYGEQAKEVIRTRAIELNTTPADLENLARTNPAMALGLLGGGTIKQDGKPSTSSMTPNRTTPNNNEKPVFEKSLTRGGVSNKELVEGWNKVKEYTHKRLGVEN